jgi:hypothetical protein
MLDSLHKNCPNALVYVLCMDEDTQNLLGKLELPYVRLIPLKEIETIELLALNAAIEYFDNDQEGDQSKGLLKLSRTW